MFDWFLENLQQKMKQDFQFLHTDECFEYVQTSRQIKSNYNNNDSFSKDYFLC